MNDKLKSEASPFRDIAESFCTVDDFGNIHAGPSEVERVIRLAVEATTYYWTGIVVAKGSKGEAELFAAVNERMATLAEKERTK